MKKVNLLNITAAFAIASLSSAFVLAEDVNTQIDTVKVAPSEQPAAALLVASNVEPATFESLDTDKDGYISAEEVSAGGDEALKSAFNKIDTNQDDLLSRDEFEQAINNL